MDTVALVLAWGPWTWIILGLALMMLELAVPGIFLLWLGIASVGTGLVAFAATLSWERQCLLFAALAAASVLAGRRMVSQGDGPGPLLNRRAASFVGREFVLDEPIVRGIGRIQIDDTVWRAIGPDAAAGTTVRVTAVDGASLVVERR